MTFMEILIVVSIGLTLLIGSLSMTDCSPPNYTRVVESQGYTSVRIKDAAYMGCAKEDSVFTSVHFEALGVNHEPVSGVICCGFIFKSCTVRIDP